jgi:DNA-binding transcriptional LysR family regulator
MTWSGRIDNLAGIAGGGYVDLDLRLVRYFVTVGTELHFGRAAAKLFISQPALSKQIRKLESELGTQLLVRDSRHVALTDRGRRFLDDARQLLLLAERMQHDPDPETVRVAHVYELDTSRIVVDACARRHPGAVLAERQLDSYGQLHALLSGQLDVAMLRVTPALLDRHPSGWEHRLLRMEPMSLIGRAGGTRRETASLFEGPIEVFGDAQGSGSYNAHGEYLTAFEQHTGIAMRWLGNPGTFNHCLAVVRRAVTPAFVLEFDSYAQRYAAAGLPVHRPAELQPYYPWSIAWRDGSVSAPVSDLVDIALRTAEQRGWLDPAPIAGTPAWLPADDPAAGHLPPLPRESTDRAR